ncbi:MAG: DNA double-strand break repair nuclease NurA, partial [Nitrososphaerales archaeon]|nr:DNA double-strand break repair nuclease NurA [Nitrososphaerales archaeon]
PISGEEFDTNALLTSLNNHISDRIMQNFKLYQSEANYNANNFNFNSLNALVRKIPKEGDPILIASIDSSSIPIANSDRGMAIAARATVVFFKSKKIHGYLKIGPIILYINESNIHDLLNVNEIRLYSTVLNDVELIQRLIRIRLERSIQLELAKHLSKALILIDGSLKPSIFECDEISLNKILKTSLNNKNICVGICKSSRITILNRFADLLALSQGAPLYLDVSELTSGLIRGLAGKVLLTKFMEGSYPLRVDVANSELHICEEILSKVYSNDLFCRGYPESLRLAHHFSVFSETEYVGMCSYVMKNSKLNTCDDHRQALLGHISFTRHMAR